MCHNALPATGRLAAGARAAGPCHEPTFKAAPQAKETNMYLQYIDDHYDKLPNSIAFIHAHR